MIVFDISDRLYYIIVSYYIIVYDTLGGNSCIAMTTLDNAEDEEKEEKEEMTKNSRSCGGCVKI